MEKELNQDVNKLKEGNAVGVWIVRKSKSYPGHNYYFNTLNGAAVWNLSEQEIANAMSIANESTFNNQAEPKEKPPMAKFNPRTGFSQPIMNNVNYPTQAFPIPPFACPQTALRNPLPFINTMDLMAPSQKLNQNVWDLGLRQQIVILPTLTPLNQQQSFSFGFDLQQSNYLKQGNDLQQRNDVQERFSQSRSGSQKKHYMKSRDMFKNRQDLNKFGGNRVQNRYHKTWNKQDLRKKLSKHKNYINPFKMLSKEGNNNSSKITQKETNQEEQEETYDSMLFEENEEDCVTKLDCKPLKDLGDTTIKKDCWYLVVDKNILINNFNYLNNLTSTDPTCCFLVPNCVLEELESYTEKEHDVTARRVLRFLSDYAHIGVKELESQSDYQSVDDLSKKIYNVCVNLEKDNYHVVLISDDKTLLKYKNIIHVFSMVEIKNMVLTYVSHHKLFSSSTKSNRVIINNQNNGANIKPDSNHDVSNAKGIFSKLQNFDERRIVSSPSKSLNTHIDTESAKKNCQIKSISDISVTINNVQDRPNIEERNAVVIECVNNRTETSTTTEEELSHTGEKKKAIKLSRSRLLSGRNTTEIPQTIGKQKFKWRKRRNQLSENNTRSSTVDSEHTVENVESLESGNNKSERKADIGRKEKSKAIDKVESNTSSILDTDIVKKTGGLECGKDTIKDKLSDLHTKMFTETFKNDRTVSVQKLTGNIETFDRRKNIIDNNLVDSEKDKNLKYLENEESSSSCTIVKQFTDDCIIINDSSSSEIISQSGSIVDSLNILNIQKGSKLLPRVNHVNKNLLNNVMYMVTSKAMEENLKIKSDEWVSRFFQIMEDVLSQILRQESVMEHIALPPPWSLQEAVKCIIKVFYCHCYVVDAANKLSIISNKIQNTQSITNILPEEFMEMYSYGVYLVDALKNVNANEDLNIASKSLSDLLHDIEFDQHDSFVDDATECKEEAGLISSIALSNSVHPDNEIQIQNCSSSQATDICPRKNVCNEEDNQEETNEIPEMQDANDGDMVDGVRKSTNNDTVPEPKIVRCFTKFPHFEERLKNSYSSLMDVNCIDNNIFSNEEDDYETRDTLMDDEEFQNIYETTHATTCSVVVEGHKKQVDLFLKDLFTHIKNVLNRVTEFCKRCVTHLNRSESTTVNMKLQVKTEKVHSEVISLHHYLNSIVSRENGEQNINFLLKKAGCDCKEVSEQYKNTILKCKEQTSAVLKIVEHISLLLKR